MDEDKGEVEHKARVMMGVVVVVEWVGGGGKLQQFVSWKVNTHYYLRSHQQPKRCQVARHTAQCDREEMLLADVLHGVNTFPLGQICLVFFRF